MKGHYGKHVPAGLERMAGRVTGLCSHPYHGLQAPGEPRMGRLLVVGQRADKGGALEFRSWGHNTEMGALRAAALGEAIERYCIIEGDDGALRRASVQELVSAGTPHISPARLLSLPPGVTRQGIFTEIPPDDRPIHWLEGADLASGTVTLLPAVYCVCYARRSGNPIDAEGPWYNSTSNGAATGIDPVAACLSGLLELLERDAFMLLWYQRLRFPFLTVDPSSRLALRIDSALKGCRIEYRLIDLTDVHDVPAVVAVVSGSCAGEVQYGIGAGVGTNPEQAAWHAIKEAFSFYSMQWRDLLTAGRQKLQAGEVRNFSDHSAYYQDVEHQHELMFLFEDRPARELGTGRGRFDGPPPVALRRLVSHLNARNIDLYAVDLTPPEVADTGLFTYKVVSPQLVPLDCDHRARHLNHERLLNEPTRRGWRTDQPRLEELNHAPHPFP